MEKGKSLALWQIPASFLFLFQLTLGPVFSMYPSFRKFLVSRLLIWQKSES